MLAIPPILASTLVVLGRTQVGRQEGRRDRAALSAGGDVPTLEVGQHGDAGEFGQAGELVEIKAQSLGRLVAQGLTMTADGLTAAGRMPACRSRQDVVSA